jgi:small subunit ribosomal protein S8
MNLSDPIADLLTRIRNAQLIRKTSVYSPSSKLRIAVLDVLKREGYIRDYSQEEKEKGKKEVKVELKYTDPEHEPVIHEIERVSKPGRRVYSTIADLKKIYSGLGIAILSTPKGVMSDHEAREANVGGEVLCKVF